MTAEASHVRGCADLLKTSPQPWTWTECGEPADPRSPLDRPRCERHLNDEENPG